MNKAEKKFLFYAVLSVFVLLAVLLGVINGMNFTMAANDADALTERIAAERGVFAPDGNKTQLPPMGTPFGGMGPMGPDSPEMRDSVRYFTVAIEKDGEAELVSYRISAVSEEEAVEWAVSLQKETTGWTHGSYRYRVTHDGERTLVTVIDQGRELLSAYRILAFSIGGTLVGTLLSFLILRLVGRKLFAPLEEADRKQKQFLAGVEQDFVLPLTVIHADAELLERANGSSEQTRSIHRQVRSLNTLVRRLGTLSVFDEQNVTKLKTSLSELLQELLDRSEQRFTERNIALERNIEENVRTDAAPDAMAGALNELIDNALLYAKSRAVFTLRQENGRIRLTACNDAELPEGSCDQVFDRFVLLSNAKDGATGLGLAYVKDVVRAHNGRCAARVTDGSFELRIDL